MSKRNFDRVQGGPDWQSAPSQRSFAAARAPTPRSHKEDRSFTSMLEDDSGDDMVMFDAIWGYPNDTDAANTAQDVEHAGMDDVHTAPATGSSAGGFVLENTVDSADAGNETAEGLGGTYDRPILLPECTPPLAPLSRLYFEGLDDLQGLAGTGHAHVADSAAEEAGPTGWYKLQEPSDPSHAPYATAQQVSQTPQFTYHNEAPLAAGQAAHDSSVRSQSSDSLDIRLTLALRNVSGRGRRRTHIHGYLSVPSAFQSDQAAYELDTLRDRHKSMPKALRLWDNLAEDCRTVTSRLFPQCTSVHVDWFDMDADVYGSLSETDKAARSIYPLWDARVDTLRSLNMPAFQEFGPPRGPYTYHALWPCYEDGKLVVHRNLAQSSDPENPEPSKVYQVVLTSRAHVDPNVSKREWRFREFSGLVLSSNREVSTAIERVGRRILCMSDQFLSENGSSSREIAEHGPGWANAIAQACANEGIDVVVTYRSQFEFKKMRHIRRQNRWGDPCTEIWACPAATAAQSAAQAALSGEASPSVLVGTRGQSRSDAGRPRVGRD